MKIAIDCRYLGKSGIGRVTEGILDSLDLTANEYWLIGRPAALNKYEGAHIVEDDSELSVNNEVDSYCWFSKDEARENIKPESLAAYFLNSYLDE